MDLPVIILVGPTAVGKTFFSIEIAKQLQTEVISADSMQIYKDMSIGTAKVTDEERQGIIHHLIDVVSPNEAFTVSDFKRLALDKIDDLHHQQKIPVIAGGTGLYVNALIYDLDFSKTIGDEKIRNELQLLYENNGANFLHQLLSAKDPVSAKKIHPNNVKRVMRAIEVCLITQKPFSGFNPDFRKESENYDFIIIGLEINRELLYNRINERVDKMLHDGLIDEVISLVKKGYPKTLPAMQGIGYKEIIDYVEGQTTFDEAIRLIKRNSRRLAKRQFTWFKADPRIRWFQVDLEAPIKTKQNIMKFMKERGIRNEAVY